MELKLKSKQNTLTVICLLCSLAGLALIYVAAINIQPQQLKLSDVNFEIVGRSVATTGYISYKSTHPAGHIFLTLSEGSAKIEVPLFAGFVGSLGNNGFDANKLKKGMTISVEGLVSEYKGQLQIIPRKPEDIKILNSYNYGG